jgi:hypothetical protein
VIIAGSSPFIVYRGRIVAVVGARRCYFNVDRLDAASIRFVIAMCLCKREVDEGRLTGPFTSALAEQWARLFLIGPTNLATSLSDAELAEKLCVPVEQVALARAELGHQAKRSAKWSGSGSSRTYVCAGTLARAESRRKVGAGADDRVSSRAGVSSPSAETTATRRMQHSGPAATAHDGRASCAWVNADAASAPERVERGLSSGGQPIAGGSRRALRLWGVRGGLDQGFGDRHGDGC